MNPEIKKLWVEALRSGKYKICKGELRIGDHFCVLGILCDLHAKATGSKWRLGNYKKCSLLLPDCVIGWAGLSGQPTLRIKGESRYIWQWFDKFPITLHQMADIIEEQL